VVWNIQTRQAIHTLQTKPRTFLDTDIVTAISVTPNGHWAIFLHENKDCYYWDNKNTWYSRLKVWNLDTKKAACTFTSDIIFSMTSVAITPDGHLAISVAADASLKVWDIETGKVLATAVLEKSLSCISVASDGLTILAGDEEGNIYCLRYIEKETNKSDFGKK
jgi:WD40 repeat protein